MPETEVKPGKLIVFSAPAAAGKGTVRAALFNMMPELVFSVSWTTRRKAETETDGADYFFVSKQKFSRAVRDGKFLEYAQPFGRDWYGTPKEPIERNLADGKDVFLEIDVKGMRQIREKHPGAITIFLHADLETLERRIRSRGRDSKEDIIRRLSRARDELASESEYDYIVHNMEGKADDAALEIFNIIKNARV